MGRAALREREDRKRQGMFGTASNCLTKQAPHLLPLLLGSEQGVHTSATSRLLHPATRVNMSDASQSYGPSNFGIRRAYDPPLFSENEDRFSCKLLVREWIQMHSKIKDIDKKSMAVYFTAGDRILMSLPHSVQFTVRQKASEGEINLCTDNEIEVVDQLLKIIATHTQVSNNTRLSKAYATVSAMKRHENQQIMEIAEKFKELGNHYLMLIKAPNASVTSEKLAHLMLINTNLSSGVHSSAIMRLTAIVSKRGQKSKIDVPTVATTVSALVKAFENIKKLSGADSESATNEIKTLISSMSDAVSNVQNKLQYVPRDGQGEEGCMPTATLSDAYAALARKWAKWLTEACKTRGHERQGEGLEERSMAHQTSSSKHTSTLVRHVQDCNNSRHYDTPS